MNPTVVVNPEKKMKGILLGPTGKVGSELLGMLLQNPLFSQITVITRRPLNIQSPKLVEHVVEYENLKENHIGGNEVMFNCLGTTRSVSLELI